MKKLIIIFLFLFLLTNCTSDIDESFIKENNKELFSIFDDAIKANIDSINAKGQSEISKRIKKLGIDRLEIKYKYGKWAFIRADSLAHFIIKNDGFLFLEDKVIIYDFAQTPRNFGDSEIIGASYYRKQVLDRWYLESIGFD